MERVITAGLLTAKESAESYQRSMDELKELVETAGGEVAEAMLQRREVPDAATFFGKGKIQDFRHALETHEATTLVINNDLKPGQQRTLENELNVKIIDRTRLILDIFAQRARTREGHLQVELAQLHYRLPRLSGQGHLLDSQTGGIGTRGPGERKLEVDRRRVRDRITFLEKQIEKMKSERQQQRAHREAVPVPQVALVGYTNAGKSTLMNSLLKTHDVYADDKLFATLDPTTRKLRLPSGKGIVITDTVGFIRQLPTLLVAAFRATLEELSQADLLLHVIDASDPDAHRHRAVVESVLKDLAVNGLPRIEVYNKIDRLSETERLFPHTSESVAISAVTHEGFDTLLKQVETALRRNWMNTKLELTHQQIGTLMKYYSHLELSEQETTQHGMRVRIQTHPATWAQLQRALALTQQ